MNAATATRAAVIAPNPAMQRMPRDLPPTTKTIVAFTAAGFPVSIKSSEESITAPRVVWAAPSAFSYEKVTRSLLSGRTGKPRLGESGQKLLSLLSWDPASAPQREAGS